MLNVKKLTKDMWMAFGASVGASGILAVLLDHLAWPHAVAACMATSHVGAGPCIFLFLLLNSLSPMVIETTDTFFISRALEAADGADFWPSKKEFWVSFKKAATCGLIASIGSLPANAVGLTNGLNWLPLGILANEVQQITSASLIPLETVHAESYLTGAVMANTFARKFYRYQDKEVRRIMDKKRGKNAHSYREAFWRTRLPLPGL